MTSYATLLFPDYATAVAAAKMLGFWDTENDRLKVQGQTLREDGSAFSWMIDEIGQDPNGLTGYAVNACGELPPAVDAYKIPYGSAGRIFAGTQPE